MRAAPAGNLGAMRRGWVWIAAWLLVLPGCVFDASVPDGVTVRCSANTECPPGYVCRVAQRRCIPGSADDTTPPAVVDGSVLAAVVPARENVLPAPTALGPNGSLRLAFSSTEELALDPEILTSAPLACTRTALTGDAWVFGCAIPQSGSSDGPVSLRARLVDLAGNEAVAELGVTVELDQVAPAAPDTATEGQIVYLREPWGTESSDGKPGWRLRGAPGAVEGGALVLVRSGDSILARAPAQSDGSFAPFSVSSADLEGFEVAAADPAGNLSDWVRVRDVEWVATLGGKEPGRLFPNPNRLELFTAHGPRLDRADGVERGEADGIARVDGLGPSVQGAASWISLNPVVAIPHYWSVGAWDEARARLVVWGGVPIPQELLLSTFPPAVREFDGRGYFAPPVIDLEGDGSPENRLGASFAYSARRGGAVLFGGRHRSTFTVWHQDCWLWNGVSWKRLPEGPSARRDAVFFYDTRRDLFVLLGGSDSAGVRGDGWVLKPGGWAAWDGGLPPARHLAAAAWDEARGVAWLFGGKGADGGVLDDLWQYGVDGWRQLDAGLGPGPRAGAKLAVDTLRGRAVLFGGTDATSALVADPLWEWDGARWSRPMPDAGPTARTDHLLTFDPVNAQTILLGGSPQPEVWGWTGAAWEQLAAARRAKNFSAAAELACGSGQPICLAAAPGGEGVVLDRFGWADAPASTRSPVPTWEASSGRFLAVENDTPAAPTDAGRTLWFDQDAGWIDLGLPPLRLLVPALAGGPDAVFLFPVDGTAEVLVRRAAGPWVPGPALPEALTQFSAAATPDGGVLVSGRVARDGGSYNATYRLVGGAWTALPVRPPLVRERIVFDERRERVLALGGGQGLLPGSGQVFSLEPSGWSEVPLSDPEGDGSPVPRLFGAAAWNPLRERTYFGLGLNIVSTGVQVFSDTWELEFDRHRPSAVFHAAIDFAAIPAAAAPRRLTLHAVAGATSEVGHVRTPGVTAAIFHLGRWRPLGSNGAPPVDGGAPVEGVETDPAALESLLRSGPELHLGLLPNGENGRDGAGLQLDYVELRVRYRLP